MATSLRRRFPNGADQLFWMHASGALAPCTRQHLNIWISRCGLDSIAAIFGIEDDNALSKELGARKVRALLGEDCASVVAAYGVDRLQAPHLRRLGKDIVAHVPHCDRCLAAILHEIAGRCFEHAY